MKRSFKFLSTLAFVLFIVTACQEQSENPNQLTATDVSLAENEAIAESTFEDIDDIAYESLLLFESGKSVV